MIIYLLISCEFIPLTFIASTNLTLPSFRFIYSKALSDLIFVMRLNASAA
jgi:hypothetical protein